MTHKVYVVTDLGPGDGGKGGVVHKLATMREAHTIIKRGGAQGSHGVSTSSGEKFNFSQWGCGTIEGIRTHISEQMIVSPEGLLNEADALRYQCGVYDPFSLLTVDEEALCATPFHGFSSRIKELARGNDPRGTVGTGVGEAYRQYQRTPEIAIKAKDLTGSDLRERLAAIRQAVQTDLQYVIEDEYLSEDRATLAEEVGLLYNDDFFDFVVRRFQEVSRLIKLVGNDYLGEVILTKPGIAVVETSHGILTDRLVGFHPHTSAIRTLPRFTHGMLEKAGYSGQTVNIGLTRAYAIRHGAGPIPTADVAMTDSLLPGSHKDTNRWQGEVRVGPLDGVLLRYALAACGGPAQFDGLAVTWFDQIQTNQQWKVCSQYVDTSDPDFFTPQGEIKFNQCSSLERQQALGQKLLDCQPKVTTVPVNPEASADELYAVCAEVAEGLTGVPVRMVSIGPTEEDKLCK